MPNNQPPVQRTAAPSLPRKYKYLIIPDRKVSRFLGLNTISNDLQEVTDGFSPDEVNWLTGDNNDCIILRRGTKLLGKTRVANSGKVTGLGIGTKVDGSQVPYFSYADPAGNAGQLLKYYDLATDDTYPVHQVGSSANLLPVGSENDDVFVEPYQNLAGAFVYLSSIKSDIYKIPTANPAYAIPHNSINFKGGIKFGQSRMLLFNNRGANGSQDLTGLYTSWIDRTLVANYMQATIAYTPVGAPALNDATPGAPANNLANGATYTAIIDGVGTGPNGVDTFKWQKGSGTFTTTVPITAGFPQYLADGVTITFAAGTGHTHLDQWVITNSVAQIINEAVGLSGSTSYGPYQLAEVPNGLPRSAFQVTAHATVVAGTETFTDDGNGNMTSNFGGTGTINYASGLLSLTFSAVTTGDVKCSYYWEDASQRGVVDMSIQYDTSQTPAPRVAGSGRSFPQFDGGGNIKLALPLANVLYGFHEKKTWQTAIPTNDDDTSSTPASNLAFRELLGISSPRGAYGNADGIYFINNANKARPQVYQILPKSGATSANIAAPKVISQFLNLSPYAFDVATVFVWDIYIIFSCQQIRNGSTDAFNSRTFVYNTKSGSWDLTDYPASVFADYEGGLLSGDPLSNNIFQLFSGFDDDGANIANYWTSGKTNHGVDGVKTTERMVVNGLIQASQSLKVSVAFDGGAFVEVKTILGTGSYVDSSRSISVGNSTVGSKINGGGGEVFANPFEIEFGINSDRYEYIRVRLEALGGGYVQVNFYTFKLNKYKGQRVPNERMVT